MAAAAQPRKDSDRDQVRKLRTSFRQATEQGRVQDACHQSWQDVVEANQSVRWTGSGALSFQRRRIPGAEVYLLTSWEEPFRGQVSFPHGDLIPEVWNAETGEVSVLKKYTVRDGRTWISCELDKNESHIVVFGRSKKAN